MRPRTPLGSWLSILLLAACGRAAPLPAGESARTVDGLTLGQFQRALAAGAREDRARGMRRLPAFGSAALPVLETFLDDKERSVRAAAIRAIGTLAPTAPIWSERLVAFLGVGQPAERTAAANALASIGAPALPALAELLARGDENARARAALTISRLPRDRATSEVWIRAASDRNWIVRREAARGLADVAAFPEHREAVLTLLFDNVPDVQALAADAAQGAARQGPVRSALLALLDSAHGKVRGAAAEALGRTEDPKIHERLADLARSDTSDVARVRAAVGHWRGTGEAEVARHTLLGALDHQRTEVRRLALRCIGELGTDAGPLVQAVAARLEDRSLRVAAIESLHRLGPAAQAAIPALQRLRTRAPPYTTRRIDAALEQIGG